MTKFEFIQEAALRLVTAWAEFTTESVATAAKALADEVWNQSDEEQPEVPEPANEKVQILANEIKRIEEETIAEKNAMKRNEGWKIHRNYYQKAGADIRFLTVCHNENINTIGDMLNIGSQRFRNLRNMGPLTMRFVNQALENLYNIKAW